MGRETHAGIVCVHLYLRADSWEERMGYLDSAKRHLHVRRKLSCDDSSDEENDDISNDGSDISDSEINGKINIPVVLPMGVVQSTTNEFATLTESSIRPIRILVDLQLEITKLMPQCPPSASLFGSIQSVSELIDYQLMGGHVGVAKRVIGEIKMPDSAICGIFELLPQAVPETRHRSIK
jgi:hypothetical protein